MSYSLSNSLDDDEAIHKPITDISKRDEIFLKEFLRDFYKKIIDINDFNAFENILIEWIKNVANVELIFELMQNHEQTKFWFSSIVGFYYQYGISCDVDKNKALELYLLTVNHDEKDFLNENFISLDNEFDILKNINIIIGKYLLSLFYYKDIIIDKRNLSGLNDLAIKRSANPIKVVLRKLQSQFKTLNISTRKIIVNNENNQNITKNVLKQQEDSGLKNDLEDYIQNKKEIETDDQKDFETYLKLAKENDSKAQYNLGNCYRFGRGVNQDYNKAFEWYFKSANNGYAEGQCSLGFFYKNGFGTDKNEKKAFENYLKSAALGSALAKNNLGYCYRYGQGVAQDHNKAFKWYFESANGGCALGQRGLGLCYHNGFGTDKDEKKAFEWYLKSATLGDAIAKNNLGVCYFYGQGVAQDYSKAFEWFSKAANDGCALGQRNLRDWNWNR